MTEKGYRERCFEEKGSSCTRCEGHSPNTERTVVHHVDGDRSNNNLDNLEPLCYSCHEKWHSKWSGEITFADFVSRFPDDGIDSRMSVLECQVEGLRKIIRAEGIEIPDELRETVCSE